MNAINSKLVLLGAVCLLSACGVQDQAAKVQENVQKVGGTQELLGMTKGIKQTLTAVKSGDFDTAKQEFSSVQEGWKGASTKLNASPETVTNIKGNLQTIATDLKASPPDKAKLVSNLQNLSGSLGNLAKGEDTTQNASTETAEDTTQNASTETAEENPIGGAETPASTDQTQTFTNNLLAMQDALAKTNTAVESNDFSTAKTSFSEARQTWFKFGGIVKEKSADSYQTLDQGVNTVNTALNQTEPTQDSLLSELQTMTSELDAVSGE